MHAGPIDGARLAVERSGRTLRNGRVAPAAALIRVSAIALCACLAVLTLAPRASAQDATAYRQAAQVEQLEAQLALLADAAAPPQALVELSRLLSEPADQLTWLLARVDAIRAAGGDEAAARPLAELARQRLTLLRGGGAAGLEPFEARLAQLFRAAQRRLAAVVDAAELAERLRRNDAADFTGLTDADRFALAARGVAADRLGLQRDPNVRGAERAAGVELLRQAVLIVAAADGRAASFADLLSLDSTVRTAAQSVQAGAGSIPGAAGAYRVAAALLGRAVGADGQDRGQPADDDPASWSQLAGELAGQDLWQWAALARVLQSAAAADGGGDARQPLADAQAMVDRAARVSGASAAAGQTALQRTLREWITALGGAGGGRSTVGLRPFGTASRSRQRQQRENHEQQFMTARASGNQDEAFRQMQLAKAAEAGAPTDAGGTLTLADVESRLTVVRRNASVLNVHLFLEMLAVNEGGRTAYYGAAVYSQQCTFAVGDTIGRGLIGPAGSASELVDQAIALTCSGKGFADGKIIIAPDGEARTAAWAGGKHNAIVAANLTKASERPWLIYMPNASFLKPGEPRRWSTEGVLAVWSRAALAGGDALRVLTRAPRARATAFQAYRPPDGATVNALDFGDSVGVIGLVVPAGR